MAYLKSEPRYHVRERVKRVLTDDVSGLIDACLKENREKRFRGDKKLCMKASDIHTRQMEAGHKYSNYRTAYLFLHQDTLAFLESHRRYFKDIGHVPHRMVYDNMRVAVASFVGGKTPTDALLRLEATYGFTHRFCNIRSGNEKGHVERSVEVVRRKAFCQVDCYDSIKEANFQILYACKELNTSFGEHKRSAKQKLEEECCHMQSLVKEIGCFEQQSYTVDKYGTVVIKGIHYSVPDTLVGKKVNIMLYSRVH